MDTKWWEVTARADYDLDEEAEEAGVSFDDFDWTYDAAGEADEAVYTCRLCCDSLDEASGDGLSVARGHSAAEEYNTFDEKPASYGVLTQVEAFEDAGDSSDWGPGWVDGACAGGSIHLSISPLALAESGGLSSALETLAAGIGGAAGAVSGAVLGAGASVSSALSGAVTGSLW